MKCHTRHGFSGERYNALTAWATRASWLLNHRLKTIRNGPWLAKSKQQDREKRLFCMCFDGISRKQNKIQTTSYFFVANFMFSCLYFRPHHYENFPSYFLDKHDCYAVSFVILFNSNELYLFQRLSCVFFVSWVGVYTKSFTLVDCLHAHRQLALVV